MKLIRLKVRAFTLLELMAVIAIIAILSTLSLGPIQASQKRGRDSQRKADLNTIAQALDLYYGANKTYPTNATGTACSAGGTFTSNQATPWIADIKDFITSAKGSGVVPIDPKKNQPPYVYTYICTSNGFTLQAKMENTNDSDSTGGIYTLQR